MNGVVMRTEAVPVASQQSDSLNILIERALSHPEIPVEKLNMLLDMRMKWDAEQRRNAKEDAAEAAKMAFTAAMAEFKKKAPTILKKHHVEFLNRAGTLTAYDHAKLADVCEAVIEGLARVGITHDWDPRQEPARIYITCTLTHVAGHTKSVTMNSGPDDSGGKNAIQAIASAKSYLERYTLLAITGLATRDMDDDGRGTGPATAPKEPAPADVLPPLPEGYTVEGYQQWAADLRAKADEGRDALLTAWKESKLDIRTYMAKHEPKRWHQIKAHADEVTKKAKGAQS